MDTEIKTGHTLRTDGPYGVTRHPIYTGILGMLPGALLLAGAGRWLLLLPVGLVLFEVKIHSEEKPASDAAAFAVPVLAADYRFGQARGGSGCPAARLARGDAATPRWSSRSPAPAWFALDADVLMLTLAVVRCLLVFGSRRELLVARRQRVGA